jgi:hypothetical protein
MPDASCTIGNVLGAILVSAAGYQAGQCHLTRFDLNPDVAGIEIRIVSQPVTNVLANAIVRPDVTFRSFAPQAAAGSAGRQPLILPTIIRSIASSVVDVAIRTLPRLWNAAWTAAIVVISTTGTRVSPRIGCLHAAAFPETVLPPGGAVAAVVTMNSSFAPFMANGPLPASLQLRSRRVRRAAVPG